MEKNPKLSIVIPAYKEEKAIYHTIDEILKSHDILDYDYEVIVVVDGSPDKTAEEARRHHSSKVKVYEYSPNHGKGYALKFGTEKAKGDIITFTDAGGDFDPRQFDKCVRLMEIFDADFVIGSKRHPASKVNYPFIRKIYSWCYQKMIRILFGLNITDTQTGLKFLKREVAKDVMPRLQVKRFAFDLEMLVIAWELGYRRIFEAPVEMNFNATGVGAGNFKVIKNMFVDTLAVFYRAKVLNYYKKFKKTGE
ncbi:MAG: glycosyltransferase [Candidatus Berkelbacteria bacterium]|nr:glycosyltransferase [Candidatus Berkelbacteria bacterium]